MLIEFVLLLVAVFAWLYYTVTKQFNYFESKGVPFAKPSFPFGSRNNKLMINQKIPFNDEVAEVAEKEMKGHKIFGYFLFGQPVWVINDDEELTKHIFVKDFDHFTDIRRFSTGGGWTKHSKINNKMFFNLRGEEWRKSRAITSGVFTSGKLKTNLPLVNKSAQQMDLFLQEQLAKGDGVIDSKDVSASYALDAFAMSGFGLESNSFKNKESIFKRHALALVGHPDYAKNFMLRMVCVLAVPKVADILGISAADPKALDYFINLVETTYKQRKATGNKKPDIIGLLVDEMAAAEKESLEFISYQIEQIV